MAAKTYEKHPAAVLDYGFNLTRWLTPPEQVVTVTPTLVNGDVVLGAGLTDGNRMSVMISGGTEGSKSEVLIVGETNSVPPRRFARTFFVYVTKKVGQV